MVGARRKQQFDLRKGMFGFKLKTFDLSYLGSLTLLERIMQRLMVLLAMVLTGVGSAAESDALLNRALCLTISSSTSGVNLGYLWSDSPTTSWQADLGVGGSIDAQPLGLDERNENYNSRLSLGIRRNKYLFTEMRVRPFIGIGSEVAWHYSLQRYANDSEYSPRLSTFSQYQAEIFAAGGLEFQFNERLSFTASFKFGMTYYLQEDYTDYKDQADWRYYDHNISASMSGPYAGIIMYIP